MWTCCLDYFEICFNQTKVRRCDGAWIIDTDAQAEPISFRYSGPVHAHRELCQAGTVVPVIDEVFALSEAANALRYVMEGRARGKVVVRVLQEAPA